MRRLLIVFVGFGLGLLVGAHLTQCLAPRPVPIELRAMASFVLGLVCGALPFVLVLLLVRKPRAGNPPNPTT